MPIVNWVNTLFEWQVQTHLSNIVSQNAISGASVMAKAATLLSDATRISNPKDTGNKSKATMLLSDATHISNPQDMVHKSKSGGDGGGIGSHVARSVNRPKSTFPPADYYGTLPPIWKEFEDDMRKMGIDYVKPFGPSVANSSATASGKTSAKK